MSMRNYIFVSDESIEELTSFYINHLKTKNEEYEIFSKPIDLLTIRSKRVVFLLKNDKQTLDSKNLDKIYKQINGLNQIEVKSTVITEQIEDKVLENFSQLNAMVLMSEKQNKQNNVENNMAMNVSNLSTSNLLIPDVKKNKVKSKLLQKVKKVISIVSDLSTNTIKNKIFHNKNKNPSSANVYSLSDYKLNKY